MRVLNTNIVIGVAIYSAPPLARSHSSFGICPGKSYRSTLKFFFSPNSDSGLRRSGTSRTCNNRVENTRQSIVPSDLDTPLSFCSLFKDFSGCNTGIRHSVVAGLKMLPFWW